MVSVAVDIGITPFNVHFKLVAKVEEYQLLRPVKSAD